LSEDKMVMQTDDWGRDPGVRAMRGVFARMESSQKTFLASLGISARDPRLRSWREKTLKSFERSWAEMARRGLDMDEERAGVLYVHLLAGVMASDGVPVESGRLQDDRDVKKFLQEVGL
jgi:hypothetical protein